MIAALLLAAGASRRFGGQKLLQDLEGRPVVRWSAERLLGPPVDELVVVVGPNHDEIRAALHGLDVRMVENAGATRGMASSLACGVHAVQGDAQAVLVALADEPSVSRAAIQRVVDRYRAGGASIVVPMYRGVRGHPVLFDGSVFGELLALSGDHGARAVADRMPERVAFVEIDGPKPIDVDTPEDLARLRAQAQNSSSSSTLSSRPP